jgi:hypothetical protein
MTGLGLITDSTTAGSGPGTPAWSSLVDPGTNLSLAMAGRTTTFTWSATTGASDLFKFADTTSNTGTGHLVSIQTAASSSLKPFIFGTSATKMEMDSAGNVAITQGQLGVGDGLTAVAAPLHFAKTLDGVSTQAIRLQNAGINGPGVYQTFYTGVSEAARIEGRSSSLKIYTGSSPTLRGTFDSFGVTIDGQVAATANTNNVTLLTLKRSTDTSPTGKFFDLQNAAGSSVASLDIAGNLTVTSCAGCGGGSGGSPGGSNTQVQFNDGGSFSGDSGLIYDKTAKTLSIVGATSADQIRLGEDTSSYYKIGRDISTGLLIFDGTQTCCIGYQFKNGNVYLPDNKGFVWGTGTSGGILRDNSTGTLSLNLQAVSGAHFKVNLGNSGSYFGVQLAGSDVAKINSDGSVQFGAVIFSNLGTPSNGTQVYCSDCDPSTGSTCASAGAKTGAMAMRINGAWKCY